jgi:hypothetical protein
MFYFSKRERELSGFRLGVGVEMREMERKR